MILLTVIAKIQKKCLNSMVKWRFFSVLLFKKSLFILFYAKDGGCSNLY